MRITTITLATAMTLSLAGAAFAQDAPGATRSGGNATGGSTTSSSGSEAGTLPVHGNDVDAGADKMTGADETLRSGAEGGAAAGAGR